ncbi:penicillin-binding protein 2 [Marinicauda algicola]|uniref:Penicillin-binding protein 2 n=1 Tax=Marinicauda algicola TaxID=2029849 RepID=A0A4S2H322_9PROT|nr:penicillin-binding protein 2 [Marinicauda algicola]TGY89995.1 penicillin-binding protein 2 [Marinicauda algicola]
MVFPLARLFGRVKVREDRQARTPPPVLEAAPADVTRLLRLDDETGAALTLSRGRLGVIGAVLGVGFALLGVRAVDLALTPHTESGPGRSYASAPAPRGEITDRDGEVLATNLDFHSLWADPSLVWDAQETAEQLATVLPDLDVERTARLLSSNRRFVWIARQLSPRQRQAIHLLGLPGLDFRIEPGRIYPKKRAAAHLVGYTDTDLNGVSGAELAFDSELSAGDGRPVSLSIDLTAQNAIERVLRARMAEFRAEGASAVLLKVGTGEIISMVSLPDFDPNRPGDEPAEARFNRPVSGVYELGSVMKPLTLAAALESGQVQLTDVFDATEPLAVGGFRIHDFHPERRPLTAREAMIHSSNIATARIADTIGSDVLTGFFSDLRLFERAPVELAESAPPLMPQRWGRVENMTASYGHGFNITPLTLAAAYAALANGGVYVPPTLRPVAPGETIAGEPVLSAATAAQVLAVMRQVVTEGSGGGADVAGLAVAGKTGTAEQIVDGRYDTRSVYTSFISIFPFDDPEYVLLVTFYLPQPTENTHGFRTAGWNAAPASGEIIAQLASILGIAPREADPQAQASVVAQMFAPRVQVRRGPEEPLDIVVAPEAVEGQEP